MSSSLSCSPATHHSGSSGLAWHSRNRSESLGCQRITSRILFRSSIRAKQRLALSSVIGSTGSELGGIARNIKIKTVAFPFLYKQSRTFLFRLESAADPQTHVVERQEVLRKGVFVLAIQFAQTAERLPDKLSRFAIALNAECRNNAVEISLLSPRPFPTQKIEKIIFTNGAI